MGLDAEAYRARRPLLTRESELAIVVWNFCDGWNPATLPLAVEYFDVRDCGTLVGLLLALRQYMAKRAELERQAIEAMPRG